MASNITRPNGYVRPVVIDGRWVADPRLSFTAVGILTRMCALPVDAPFEFDEAAQSVEFKAAMWDLLQLGYLVDDEQAGLSLTDPNTAAKGDRA